MTFLEAAVEVLRRERKPLPVRRLVELAIQRNLLSVVGRDPEATMQERIEEAFERHDTKHGFVKVKDGVYGLHVYPTTSAPEPAAEPDGEPEAEAEKPAEAAPAEGGEGATKKRRRRGRRGGRGRNKGAKTTAAGSEAATDEPAEAEEPTEGVAAAEGAEAAEGEAERRAGQRSRRGGRGRRSEDQPAEAAPVEEPAPAEAAPVEAAEAPDELLIEDELVESEGDEAEEFDLPSGPLLAPALGDEDATRGEEDREVRAEIPGSGGREERSRRRRGRGRDRRERDKPRNGEPKAQEHAPRREEPRREEPGREEPRRDDGRPRALIDQLLDVLRTVDGRPLHVKHLAEQLARKQGGEAGELVLQVRSALIRDQRDREAEGLRPRVRPTGGGHWAVADKRLDAELVPLERDLSERAGRLRDATKHAVRRRVLRLSPPAFEALGRVLVEKLGLADVQLIKRGDGVAYFGGKKQLGVGSVKTLVAMRPGEAEISRRAVGELRAGLAAKGFDEGLLLAAGRAGDEALAELQQKGGGTIVVHDGLSLAGMCVRHGLGVRRAWMPVDYLDVEWFGELSE